MSSPAATRSVLRRAMNRLGRSREDLGGEIVAALSELDQADRAIVQRALPYTMTGVARLGALVDAVRYIDSRGLPGAFVECGVWRGGSVLAMIATLQAVDAEPRDIWLYDTFEGMTEPTEHDTSDLEPPPLETWREAQARGERPWSELFSAEVFNQEQVRSTLLATGYPAQRLHFIRGPVEKTLPGRAPEGDIALLRLDTDWYESTRHELVHLYPSLAGGGVLIVDDYGHFQGARRAVDEYFAPQGGRGRPLLLTRIDYTARLAVKA